SDPDATCEEFQPDFVYGVDPTEVGVDNSIANLVPTIENLFPIDECPDMERRGCFDAHLADDIASGAIDIAFVVDGVNDYEDDPSVSVRFFDRTAGTTSDAIPGAIVAGRLEASGRGEAFSFLLLATRITLSDPRFDLRAVDVTSGLGMAEGAIGAEITVDSIVEALLPLPGPTIGDLRSTIRSLADLHPSDDPSVCQALSIGLAFAASPEEP
ncbi:MAG: hypothetical protein AB7S26_41600, partial [Sandaracinaceae bacterium]